MQRFTDLAVWQRSHQLVLKLYKLTAAFPSDERFGLVSSATSSGGIGADQHHRGFKETESGGVRAVLERRGGIPSRDGVLVDVSKDLGFVQPQAFAETTDEIAAIARMLHALRLKVERPTRGS